MLSKKTELYNPGREAFIKEQMCKRLGQTEDEATASGSQLHPDDELYAVPADLQVSPCPS